MTQLGAWYGSVPGDVQTPPRAALMALVQALSTTSGDLLVKPDASYLVDGISKGRHLNAQGTHADLWYQVGRLMAARGAPTEVAKVTAHLDDEPVLSGEADLQDFVGNCLADAWAARGANLAELPAAAPEAVKVVSSKAEKVLARLVETSLFALEQQGKRKLDGRPAAEKGGPTALQALAQRSNHDFGIEVRHASRLPAWVSCRGMQAGLPPKSAEGVA